MRNRLTKIMAAVTAVAALAFGGAALAGAAQNGGSKAPVSQSQEPVAPDTDNVQQGDQSAPDKADAQEPAESGTEAESADTEQNDGPGGYADPTDAADTQQQGAH